MKIIHLTSTPLAGAPIRLSNALNKYTEFKSRVINFNPYAYGARTFPEDLCFHQNPALCLDLISEADVIHFHHPYMDFFTESGGYSLDKIKSRSAKCIYHYHSSPVNLKKVADTVKPSLVVAHCAERYFPHARLMPNVVDPDFLEQNVSLDCNTVRDLSFAPSNVKAGAWSHRWETKGAPETIKILRKVNQLYPEKRVGIFHDLPFAEVINAKANSLLILDEVVTGSYHQGALEGLALSKPVICYSDERAKYILLKLTGAKELPFINLKLEDLEHNLPRLLNTSKSEKIDMGLEAKKWFDRFYAPKTMVDFYVSAYEDLFESERLFIQKTMDERSKDFDPRKAGRLIYHADSEWKRRRRRETTLNDLWALKLKELKVNLRAALVHKLKNNAFFYQKIFPHLNKVREQLKHINYPIDGVSVNLQKGKYNNDRCFIIGNGPSINYIDLKHLNNEYCFVVNKGFFLKQKGLKKTSFYCLSDVNASKEYGHLIDEEFAEHFISVGLGNFGDRSIKNLTQLALFGSGSKEHQMKNGFFQFDINEPLAHSKTVVLHALQVAAYLGFKKIYFVGVDNNMSTLKNAHWYKDSKQEVINLKVQIPPEDEIEKAFRMAKESVAKTDVELFNASPNSELRALPKVNYQDLFR